jgi:HlyD family secretion protein
MRCSEKPETASAGKPELEVRAVVAPALSATAAASIDGRIATVLVQEGAIVQPGQIVATLVNPSIDRDLASAKAQVILAEGRLRQANRPASRIVRDDGGRERASAQILKNRESKRARYRQLYQTRDISRQDLEDAENEYAAALRDWLAERERTSQTTIHTDTNVLQLELERARADVAVASDRRSLLDVKTPIGGIVTRVASHPGQSVFPRDPIVEVANTAYVEVRGTVAPELTSYVRRGMTVETRVFTVPPRRYNVPLKNVLPGQGGSTIVVELPNPDGMLQEGQTAVMVIK